MAPFRRTSKSTPEQALQALKVYCGYQERCHNDVKQKLSSMGVWGESQGAIISTLIEEDYLNEERFARVFAGGKFRVNKWGRNRIKYALKQKKLSDYCIKKALLEIDPTEYENVLTRLAQEKFASTSGHKSLRRAKTIGYLMGRGFEADLIKSVLASISHEDE